MDPAEIVLTKHAVKRFRERFRPTVSAEVAKEELSRIVKAGEITKRGPDGMFSERNFGFLVVYNFMLPLMLDPKSKKILATTCIPREKEQVKVKARQQNSSGPIQSKFKKKPNKTKRKRTNNNSWKRHGRKR